MPDVISVRGLGRSFGAHRVLEGLDLSVREGSIYALLGANGAGKTTLVRILSTLLRPDTGTATVAGYDVVDARRDVQRRITVTGQSAAVDDLLTGQENLVLMGRLCGLSRRGSRRRAEELLGALDLAEAGRRRVGTWSGGMRRRLDLATTLVVPAPVVFLDEPTTGLDTRSRRGLWDVVRGLAADGATVLLTTQYLEEADRLADRIGVLHDGHLVAEGTAAQLKARVGGPVLTLTGLDGTVRWETPTDGTAAGVQAALSRPGTPTDGLLGLRTPTLDDVFLALTDDAPPPGTASAAAELVGAASDGGVSR